MGALVAAGLWGFAEATLFFLVPDVMLTAIAVVDWRLALVGCLAALAGALAGGAVMYTAGRSGEGARRLLLRVPGISPAMAERVRREVGQRRFLAVLLGPLSGTPYKLYAVEAGRQRLSAAGFMLISVPSRLVRFVAVTALAGWLAHGVFPGLATGWKLAAWGVVWSAFYAWYFRAMRRRSRIGP